MSNKNLLIKKRQKLLFKQSDENDPNRKLNEKFVEKCYFYNLPINWEDEYTYLNVDNNRKTKLSNIYNTVKQQLSNKSISICDILKITGVTHNERLEMIEDYAIMQSYDSDIKEYVRLRRLLNKRMDYYKDRDVPFNEITDHDKQKNRLANLSLSNNQLEEKILNLDINEYTQAILYQKYVKLTNMSTTDSEYHKLNEWLNFVVDIPFNVSKPIKLENINEHESVIATIKRKLDTEIYGMEHVKEEIILFLRQKLKNPNATNLSLALAGPAGVGKTKIIRTLSEILDLPFEHISMGGVSDVSFLSGSLYVYEGSKPGKIATTMHKLGCNNGIFFFDEIDKISDSSKAKEVSAKLIHMTDFTQNSTFSDDYCPEINIDLSKIWYMFSLNDEQSINPILKDRLYIVNVPGYSSKDKKQLITKHIVPEIIDRLQMNPNDIIMTEDIQKYIIDKCKHEEGIRELKRVIEMIYRKLDTLCDLCKDEKKDVSVSFQIKNFSVPHKLTTDDIRLLMKHYDTPKEIPGLYV